MLPLIANSDYFKTPNSQFFDPNRIKLLAILSFIGSQYFLSCQLSFPFVVKVVKKKTMKKDRNAFQLHRFTLFLHCSLLWLEVCLSVLLVY